MEILEALRARVGISVIHTVAQDLRPINSMGYQGIHCSRVGAICLGGVDADLGLPLGDKVAVVFEGSVNKDSTKILNGYAIGPRKDDGMFAIDTLDLSKYSFSKQNGSIGISDIHNNFRLYDTKIPDELRLAIEISESLRKFPADATAVSWRYDANGNRTNTNDTRVRTLINGLEDWQQVGTGVLDKVKRGLLTMAGRLI